MRARVIHEWPHGPRRLIAVAGHLVDIGGDGVCIAIWGAVDRDPVAVLQMEDHCDFLAHRLVNRTCGNPPTRTPVGVGIQFMKIAR